MNKYVEHIISLLSKPGYKLNKRSELTSVYALSEDEVNDEILDYEVSLINKLKRRHFHTVDYNGTGSYDFHFGGITANKVWYDIYDLEKGDYETPVCDVYVTIYAGGTLEANGELLTISDELIMDHEWGWEIENEIKDIIKKIIVSETSQLLDNTNFWDDSQLMVLYGE